MYCEIKKKRSPCSGDDANAKVSTEDKSEPEMRLDTRQQAHFPRETEGTGAGAIVQGINGEGSCCRMDVDVEAIADVHGGSVDEDPPVPQMFPELFEAEADEPELSEHEVPGPEDARRSAPPSSEPILGTSHRPRRRLARHTERPGEKSSGIIPDTMFARARTAAGSRERWRPSVVPDVFSAIHLREVSTCLCSKKEGSAYFAKRIHCVMVQSRLTRVREQNHSFTSGGTCVLSRFCTGLSLCTAPLETGILFRSSTPPRSRTNNERDERGLHDKKKNKISLLKRSKQSCHRAQKQSIMSKG